MAAVINLESITRHSLTLFREDGQSFNTWNDYFLVPSGRLAVAPPPVQRIAVSVPGRDGALDFTTALDGEIHYENRTGDWEFLVDNQTWNERYRIVHGGGSLGDGIASPEILSHQYDFMFLWTKLLADIHGHSFAVSFDGWGDIEGVYRGRLWVSDIASDAHNSKFTIEYDLLPFRYAASEAEGGGVAYTKVGF